MSLNAKLIYTLLLIASLNLPAINANAETYVPDELRPWQDWVLKDKEYRRCPFIFDQSADQADAFVCSWPGTLQLDVDASGARFVQSWTVFATEQWITLPGSPEHWPDQVTVNDRQIEVVARNGMPGIELASGSWRISGRFRWDERPAVLQIPPRSAVLALSVDGKPVARPEFNQNLVYLGERQRETRARDAIRTVVHRLVIDDIPTQLITRLQIDVSGSVREEVFGPILPDGFVPVSIHSPLPAKLEADGKLRVQVRPGRWTLSLAARGAGVSDSIARPPKGVNLADDEIWSYRSNDQLRVTAVEELPPVDPAQVETPGEWQSLPAFRMHADAVFAITERSRGLASAANELGLNRTMWLGFDGKGYIVEDRIGGTMRTDWRLDMGAPYELLSAKEREQSLLITAGQEDGQTGVEVRQSQVDVAAIGRADTRAGMPVTGWDTRFARVQTTLNLPPGHKLLLAPGVDSAAGSWMSQWQLLDFFLVLIMTIAVWRLFGVKAGVIALGALALSFHEFNAPSWLWLNLLIVIALMRVTPAGRLKQLVSSYQVLSVIALIVVLVPFIAGQLRIAIYPQLESQAMSYGALGFSDQFESPATEPARQNAPESKNLSALRSSVMAIEEAAGEADEIVVTGKRDREFSRYAANAIVQAGPGIPSWRWNSYSLAWSGPVDAEQSMRLVVMPRWLVSLMRVLAVGLLLLFAGVLAAEIVDRRWRLPAGLILGGKQASSFIAVSLLAGLLAASPEAKADFPDAGLLQQLQQRLLEPPACVPRCAEIVSADVDISAEEISMTLSVHALENVAIPLPGSADGWRPEAIAVDGGSSVHVFRAANNSLWLHVEPGRHRLTLRGSVPAVDSLEIPFLTPPRVVTVKSDAWLVAGIKDRRLTSGSLQLTRLQTATGGDGTVRWESSRFPVFVRVERVVELDLDWRVRTTVYRVAPTQGALTLEIPLLKGEAIVSGEFSVSDNQVLVSMNPQQQAVSWTSNLPLESPLTLTAADGASWQEIWHFAIGNTWNAKFEGIPESNMSNTADGVRVAVFHPRAGEELQLVTDRPAASAGSTLAFDSVNLSVVEGSRSRDVSLHMSYRSTRGSQHQIQLPADAEISAVLIDQRAQIVRADEGRLNLEILPGNHTIAIDWRENGSPGLRTSTPEIDIGAPASNIALQVTKSQDRWLLATGGPKLGPAVLYWSELVVLIVFAVILGRINLTPLSTRHWILLGLGFSTFNWPVMLLVVTWLMLCGVREKVSAELPWWKFNLVQIVIAVVTLVALASIVLSLPAGLLGAPDMHVVGQNSYGNTLHWFADRSDSVLPTASAISVPMWIYKALILTWALWLSFAMLRWLPWVWQCFSADGFWRRRSTARLEASSDEGAA